MPGKMFPDISGNPYRTDWTVWIPPKGEGLYCYGCAVPGSLLQRLPQSFSFFSSPELSHRTISLTRIPTMP